MDPGTRAARIRGEEQEGGGGPEHRRTAYYWHIKINPKRRGVGWAPPSSSRWPTVPITLPFGGVAFPGGSLLHRRLGGGGQTGLHTKAALSGPPLPNVPTVVGPFAFWSVNNGQGKRANTAIGGAGGGGVCGAQTVTSGSAGGVRCPPLRRGRCDGHCAEGRGGGTPPLWDTDACALPVLFNTKQKCKAKVEEKSSLVKYHRRLSLH